MILPTRVQGNPTWLFIETQPGGAAIYVTYNQPHFSTGVTSRQVHHAHQGSNLYQKTILECLVADAEYLFDLGEQKFHCSSCKLSGNYYPSKHLSKAQLAASQVVPCPMISFCLVHT